jgi:hypothetical protein
MIAETIRLFTGSTFVLLKLRQHQPFQLESQLPKGLRRRRCLAQFGEMREQM